MNSHAYQLNNCGKFAIRTPLEKIPREWKENSAYETLGVRRNRGLHSGSGSSSISRHVFSAKLKGARKVYTRKGDSGWCNLLSGQRVMKDTDQIEACGDVDELNSVLGLIVNALPRGESRMVSEIEEIQMSLFRVGALIATDPLSTSLKHLSPISREQIRMLEHSIDSMEEQLPELKNFIIPGGHASACQANLARSVCRRAERHVLTAFKNNNFDESPESMQNVLAYLNRLSDYLFVLGRYCNFLFYSAKLEHASGNFRHEQEIPVNRRPFAHISCSEQVGCS